MREDYIQSMVAAGYAEEEVKGWMDFIKERIDTGQKSRKSWGLNLQLVQMKFAFNFNVNGFQPD